MNDQQILDLIDQAVRSEADDAEITVFVVAALGLRLPKTVTV